MQHKEDYGTVLTVWDAHELVRTVVDCARYEEGNSKSRIPGYQRVTGQEWETIADN
jgi:hypothetical protein